MRLLCLCLLLTSCFKPEPAQEQKNQLTQFPGLSIRHLTAEQQSGFIKLLNDEICPCTSCQQSFAACLPKCKSAFLLAQWIIKRIEGDIPLEFMVSNISQEVNSGFSSSPQIIDLKDYNSKGSASAKLTIVEFADFECGHCKQTAKSMEELLKKHPEVRLVYKHLPLETHKNAKNASIAAEAAAMQNKFWPMHKALFESEQPLSSAQIEALASKIKGLDIARFRADLNNPKVLEKVENSQREAQLLGISGTPALFFNGRPFHLSTDLLGLELRLAMEEARSEPSCH